MRTGGSEQHRIAKLWPVLAAAVIAGSGSVASASTAISTFKVSVKVVAQCLIQTQDVNLGQITTNPTSPATGSGVVNYLCSDVDPALTITDATHGPSKTTYTLTSGANKIPFQICYGNGSCLIQAVNDPSVHLTEQSPHQLAGAVRRDSRPGPYAAGAYVDIVTATLIF